MDYKIYYKDRMACLEKLLRVNEEFLSKADDWESYDARLSERDVLIGQLGNLDAEYGEDAISCCSSSEIEAMNRILHLVLALDRDLVSAIENERRETLESMKAATMNKKVSVYGYTDTLNHGGRLLDRKE
ncbi:hypothetical protein MASR2M70_22420 [Bacillota bacterium]